MAIQFKSKLGRWFAGLYLLLHLGLIVQLVILFPSGKALESIVILFYGWGFPLSLICFKDCGGIQLLSPLLIAACLYWIGKTLGKLATNDSTQALAQAQEQRKAILEKNSAPKS